MDRVPRRGTTWASSPGRSSGRRPARWPACRPATTPARTGSAASPAASPAPCSAGSCSRWSLAPATRYREHRAPVRHRHRHRLSALAASSQQSARSTSLSKNVRATARDGAWRGPDLRLAPIPGVAWPVGWNEASERRRSELAGPGPRHGMVPADGKAPRRRQRRWRSRDLSPRTPPARGEHPRDPCPEEVVRSTRWRPRTQPGGGPASPARAAIPPGCPRWPTRTRRSYWQSGRLRARRRRRPGRRCRRWDCGQRRNGAPWSHQRSSPSMPARPIAGHVVIGLGVPAAGSPHRPHRARPLRRPPERPRLLLANTAARRNPRAGRGLGSDGRPAASRPFRRDRCASRRPPCSRSDGAPRSAAADAGA